MSAFNLDGNPVDMLTISVGVVSFLIPPLKRKFITKEKPYFAQGKATVDMLNGVMLVPFFMMFLSAFSSNVMNELITSAKLTVAIGGVAGLIFVMGEFFKN